LLIPPHDGAGFLEQGRQYNDWLPLASREADGERGMMSSMFMFFSHWWQGIVFGVFTTVALLVVAHFFTSMWEKYEEPRKAAVHECDGHHH